MIAAAQFNTPLSAAQGQRLGLPTVRSELRKSPSGRCSAPTWLTIWMQKTTCCCNQGTVRVREGSGDSGKYIDVTDELLWLTSSVGATGRPFLYCWSKSAGKQELGRIQAPFPNGLASFRFLGVNCFASAIVCSSQHSKIGFRARLILDFKSPFVFYLFALGEQQAGISIM